MLSKRTCCCLVGGHLHHLGSTSENFILNCTCFKKGQVKDSIDFMNILQLNMPNLVVMKLVITQCNLACCLPFLEGRWGGGREGDYESLNDFCLGNS